MLWQVSVLLETEHMLDQLDLHLAPSRESAVLCWPMASEELSSGPIRAEIEGNCKYTDEKHVRTEQWYKVLEEGEMRKKSNDF